MKMPCRDKLRINNYLLKAGATDIFCSLFYSWYAVQEKLIL